MSPIIAVAPMMDYTDRHDRYFLRLLAPHVRLYTEMITTHALIHGNREHLLQFHPHEKYLALQVGGSDPLALAECALMAEDWGYDEINLNVGCPSERVRKGRFGACLMLEPQLVAACIAAMQAKVKIPVTIKCRIGVDHDDSYAALVQFVRLNQQAGCQTFILHARKAWLSGLSPKENRDIPPLNYAVVRQIKKDFPTLTIVLNGGLQTLNDIDTNLAGVDGVMIGRSAYANPYLLALCEEKYFSYRAPASRQHIIRQMFPYIKQQLSLGVKLSAISRHLLGLYQNMPGARAFRRHLSQCSFVPGAGVEVIEQALEWVRE
jgi:tRNA-dihydrouridine synthase A